jgi:hypothetical protein
MNVGYPDELLVAHGMKGEKMNFNLQRDTNGDGDCGSPACPECGISAVVTDQVKLCLQCRYVEDVLVKAYRRMKQGEEFNDLEREANEYLCSHPKVVLTNPVNGVVTMQYCIRERQEGWKCGLGGKYWEAGGSN